MCILYVKSCTFVKSLLKRICIYIFIFQIAKQLFNIMSFRISNFRAIDPKVVELCVVEKCVFSAFLVGIWQFCMVVTPGWSLRREIGYVLLSLTQ
jgi:hypothetical protein